jgi:hypothetical protein
MMQDHIGTNAAPVAAATAAAIIEAGKILIFTMLFSELFRLKYLDLILLLVGSAFLAASLYTSSTGAAASLAKQQAEAMEAPEKAETITAPHPTEAPAALNFRPANTEQSRHLYKAEQARAEQARAQAETVKAQAEILKTKAEEARARDAKKNLFLKSNQNLIYILEALNLLFAFCIGYIESRRLRPTEADDEEALPDIETLKRDFVSARHKADKGNRKAAERMKEIEAKLLSLGEQVPQRKTQNGGGGPAPQP